VKVAALITRILLGLMFTIFGLNGFIHFLQMPAPANPLAVQYMTVLTESHYFAFVFLVQLIAGILLLIGGILLLIGRFVPLALALLAPVLANILLYHSLMDPSGLPLGIFATLLWLVTFWSVRSAFYGILRPSIAPTHA